jgi:ABC-type glutathione transport system ATPase component
MPEHRVRPVQTTAKGQVTRQGDPVLTWIVMLRDISATIPKRRLTVFTGVSGSGKSSLDFGTIAAMRTTGPGPSSSRNARPTCSGSSPRLFPDS